MTSEDADKVVEKLNKTDKEKIKNVTDKSKKKDNSSGSDSGTIFSLA